MRIKADSTRTVRRSFHKYRFTSKSVQTAIIIRLNAFNLFTRFTFFFILYFL
ncbi:hypothetical protein HMPREF0496_1813 [Lentilactobacillus hilgardii ATCC 27305]|nr:hypothetical protein HMPREF0496_1813 [Lentilactobacillus hilgardii ATCC 27305]